MVKKIILFLSFISSYSLAQITLLDSSVKQALAHYDVYLLGEQHGYNGSDSIEIKLIQLLHTKSTKVLMEGPYNFNLGFDEIYHKNDTSTFSFDVFNPSKTNLFRYLYYNHIPLKVIDVIYFKNWSKYWFEQLLTEKLKDEGLKYDLLTFSEIGSVNFRHKKRDMRHYLGFIENYKQKKLVYAKDLGPDFTRVDEFFMAMEAQILIEQEYSDKTKLLNTIREEYMFERIAKEIKDTSNSKVLSIHGWAHTCLDSQLKGVTAGKDWAPLAYRIRTSFPEKKVCSIMIWNRREMSGFPFYYPDDAKYILKNTERGKIYIINVDYPGTPFKNTVGKFTHIVVF